MGEVKRKVLIATFTLALSLAVIAAAVFAAATDFGSAEERPVASQLDMVAYDPPEWAKDKVDECWYLKDRKTNSAGWAIKIDGDWVVLPVSSQTDMGQEEANGRGMAWRASTRFVGKCLQTGVTEQ